MKLLLDSCVWGGVLTELRAAGHDVVWTGEWTADPGDEEILMVAHEQRRVLVTLDKDFGELAIVRGVAHSGILRIVGLSARMQGRACLRAIDSHADDLASGALVTVERGRIRIRPR